MISVENLYRFYGDFCAVNNLSFHIERGQVVGFLGPNGAGKTTTMRMLTGYLRPSEGHIQIAGVDMCQNSLEARRHIGYLPESVPLYEEMTVHAYLSYMAALRRVDQPRQAVERAMERCQIEHRAQDLIGTLSKGLRQRVGLAQAIVHEPDVLILDEPTIGLDPRQITEVRALIRELGQTHTVLLSTHILPEVSQLCQRVLILHQGQLVAEGSPAELTARLEGGRLIQITVGGAPDEVEKVLGAMPDLRGFERVADQSWQIACPPTIDLRAEIARQVVEQGLDLLELRQNDLSLEEIFIKLTTRDVEEAHDA